MASLFDKVKQLFRMSDIAKADTVPNSADISPFITAIMRDDFNEIESARDWIKPEHLQPLIAHYWTLTDWQHKRALVEIIQDRHHNDMQPMMLDFLRAPGRGDQVDLAKAVALGFMGEEYDSFMTYYNDRELLVRDVQEVLDKHELAIAAGEDSKGKAGQVEKTAQPPAQAPASNKSPAQRLVDAAMSGSVADAQQALTDGVDINTIISDGTFTGCTPLMLAINQGKLEVANLLIDQGADIHLRRRNKHRPNDPMGSRQSGGQHHRVILRWRGGCSRRELRSMRSILTAARR